MLISIIAVCLGYAVGYTIVDLTAGPPPHLRADIYVPLQPPILSTAQTTPGSYGEPAHASQ